ncbi:hypothetical protein mru_0301 [Methanobrevibacter ruminantium M1]|uniref:Uncharacterized protein n=2 Tax=Methanobrevibacter ruminantium TaxID=83816 RepID=D3DZX7_METRM|nr:hypothetical protein mru_0301 [Methanobrevibacter ruminantium M1]
MIERRRLGMKYDIFTILDEISRKLDDGELSDEQVDFLLQMEILVEEGTITDEQAQDVMNGDY